jgi:cephalosporin hydroxylase
MKVLIILIRTFRKDKITMKTLDQIKEYVVNVGSNSVGVFGGNFEGGYELQQDIVEVSEFIMDHQTANIQNYIEIGCAAGGFTRLFCDIINVENVYTIDLGNHPSIDNIKNPKALDRNIKNTRHTGGFERFIGDSHSQECKEWIQKQNVKFDFVFIDGDHSYGGVRQDTELVLPYINLGCIVMYHDHIVVNDIVVFVKELKNNLFPDLSFVKEYKGYLVKGIAVFTKK